MRIINCTLPVAVSQAALLTGVLIGLFTGTEIRAEGFLSKLRQVIDGFSGESDRQAADAGGGNPKENTEVLYRFFDESFTPGGFVYAYPEQSEVSITESVMKNGEVSLQFDLVPSDYSGGSVCLYNGTYDLKTVRSTGGRLQFWIKGNRGGEQVLAALVDEAVSDNKKTVVRLRVDWFGCDSVTTGWTLVSIPLLKYKEYGLYWDAIDSVEVEERFDWDKVAEFRIEVRKDENRSFRVWVDDVFIVR